MNGRQQLVLKFWMAEAQASVVLVTVFVTTIARRQLVRARESSVEGTLHAECLGLERTPLVGGKLVADFCYFFRFDSHCCISVKS